MLLPFIKLVNEKSAVQVSIGVEQQGRMDSGRCVSLLVNVSGMRVFKVKQRYSECTDKLKTHIKKTKVQGKVMWLPA